MSTTPPGWYDDGRGAMRWWDGRQWTEHVATPDPEPAQESEWAAGGPERADAAGVDALPPELRPDLDPANAVAMGTPPAAGYPGYSEYAPGGYAGEGAFVAATEPNKSKLWIVWVVIGVVLLGIVIAAAVVIPLLLLNLARTAEPAPGPTVESVSPAGAEEQAAVDAVDLYDGAWQSADCELLAQATTDDFLTAYGLEDCASFQSESQLFTSSLTDYVVTVTGIDNAGDTITVTTTESYLSLLDEEGNELDEPLPFEQDYTYVIVVEEDGTWAIDDIS